MFFLGLIILIVSIVAGYLINNGDLWLLWQPGEIVIILGGSFAGAAIASPYAKIVQSFRSLSYLLKGVPHKKSDYNDLLVTMFKIFRLLKVKGMVEFESHIDNPENSDILSKNSVIMSHGYVMDFIRDNMRLISMGVSDQHHMEQAMDAEIDVYESSFMTPSKNFLSLGDSMPAMGIVAAVLGVILSMKSISEPPAVLGGMIAAALVGTFSGVLFAYGVFNPIGHFLAKYSDYQVNFLEVIKIGISSYVAGHPPTVIVEFMRKNISPEHRPSFVEIDKIINSKLQ